MEIHSRLKSLTRSRQHDESNLRFNGRATTAGWIHDASLQDHFQQFLIFHLVGICQENTKEDNNSY